MKLSRAFGIFLIIFGVLYLGFQLLYKTGFIEHRLFQLWPLSTLTLGILFELIYILTRRNPGFLIPGGILVVIGTLHMFEVLTHWRFAALTWPAYVLAPAFGLFQYSVATKKKEPLVASFVLLIIGLFLAFIALRPLFFTFVDYETAFAGLIILLGLVILVSSFGKK